MEQHATASGTQDHWLDQGPTSAVSHTPVPLPEHQGQQWSQWPGGHEPDGLRLHQIHADSQAVQDRVLHVICTGCPRTK